LIAGEAVCCIIEGFTLEAPKELNELPTGSIILYTQPERIRERETPIIGSVPPDRLFITGSRLLHDTHPLPSSES